MATPRFIILCVLVAAAAALLVLTGHGPHVVGYLPFLVLFTCPLMHVFMHPRVPSAGDRPPQAVAGRTTWRSRAAP